jgi:hypothetical protein
MNRSGIAHLRLHNLGISSAPSTTPAEVVERLVAVQAQDYYAAQWALGIRMQLPTQGAIEQALANGSILRTHVLRPTWHFVTPADIRWLLALTAPRVHQINATMYRQQGLDSSTLKRSHDALALALQGGNQLIRTELQAGLQKAGIAVDGGLRLSYLVMAAELDGILCSGGRRGKQFTYALLDERAPQARRLEREQALAELARRYFTSRGPATVHDLAKWSGLTVADAKHGLESVQEQFERQELDGRTFWFSATRAPQNNPIPAAYLLSVYDECLSSYKDRSAIVDEGVWERLAALENALRLIIVVDGLVVGTWKPIRKKEAVSVKIDLYAPLTEAQNRAVNLAARGYGEFIGLPVEGLQGTTL